MEIKDGSIYRMYCTWGSRKGSPSGTDYTGTSAMKNLCAPFLVRPLQSTSNYILLLSAAYCRTWPLSIDSQETVTGTWRLTGVATRCHRQFCQEAVSSS